MNTCVNCKFWVEHTFSPNDKSRGYCHRNPPISNSGPLASWPMSYEDDWCGEFENAFIPDTLGYDLSNIKNPSPFTPVKSIQVKSKSKKVKHVTIKDTTIV